MLLMALKSNSLCCPPSATSLHLICHATFALSSTEREKKTKSSHASFSFAQLVSPAFLIDTCCVVPLTPACTCTCTCTCTPPPPPRQLTGILIRKFFLQLMQIACVCQFQCAVQLQPYPSCLLPPLRPRHWLQSKPFFFSCCYCARPNMKYDYIFVCWQIFIVLGKMPQEKPNKKHKDKEDLHTEKRYRERERKGGAWHSACLGTSTFSSDLLEKKANIHQANCVAQVCVCVRRCVCL